MTLSEIRDEMNALWASADREADSLKDPFLAMERVQTAYRAFEPLERAHVEEVLAEWVLSEDEAKRFDAIAVVRELGVVSATPALRSLEARLRQSDDPGAPFEREKVSDVLSELGAGGTAPA